MLFMITFAFATGSGEAQTLNPFEIVLFGFSFVFCMLLILSLATSVLGKLFARMPAAELSSPASVLPSTTPSPPKSDFDIDESDPHHIAVIAAAIHCAMDGRKHRIVSIRPSDSNWAAEGRRQIFSSRKVR